MRKIAVICKKGGVGKSTTAVNITTVLHQNKYRVLLVDTDPTTNATSFVGVESYNLAKNINSLFTTNIDIHEVITETPFGLKIIPSHPDLEFTINGMKPSQVGFIKTIFKDIENEFDYIIFDTPPADNTLTTSVLNYVNEVIITVQAHFSSIMPLSQTFEIINQMKQGLNPDLKVIGILPTMVNMRTTNSKAVLQELERLYNGKVFSIIIEQSIKHPEASLNGVPIVLYDPTHSGSTAYKKLTEEILKIWQNKNI